MCWICHQSFLLYISGLENSPGGGETTFDFMVGMFTGGKGCRPFGSVRTFMARGLESKMPSMSVIIFNKDSSSRHSPCVFKSDPRIALAEQICCSQTPPIWLAKICCSPTLPLNLWHSIELEITFFTAELAPTIQYLAPCISFKVNPRPPWATLLWQCLVMRSDSFPFLSTSIGCLQSSLIWEFCYLPPTRITSDSWINGSSWDIMQFLFNLLESLSFSLINFNHLYSSLKCFCCTNFTNDILDSWIWLWLSVLLLLHQMLSFFFALF